MRLPVPISATIFYKALLCRLILLHTWITREVLLEFPKQRSGPLRRSYTIKKRQVNLWLSTYFSLFTSTCFFNRVTLLSQMLPLPWICLLLLSSFSRVQLCATPETAAHQAPPSLGFSRQEHWSGLPFPSLMHASEKWKWSRSVMSDC